MQWEKLLVLKCVSATLKVITLVVSNAVKPPDVTSCERAQMKAPEEH